MKYKLVFFAKGEQLPHNTKLLEPWFKDEHFEWTVHQPWYQYMRATEKREVPAQDIFEELPLGDGERLTHEEFLTLASLNVYWLGGWMKGWRSGVVWVEIESIDGAIFEVETDDEALANRLLTLGFVWDDETQR